MMKETHPLFCAVLLLLTSLACTLGQSQPPPQAPQQQNDTTTSVSLTLTAIALQNPAAPNAQPTLPAPVVQPTQPSQQPAQAVQPTPIPPTAVQIPCDRASFVKDVTISDGAKLKAGETFNKTWTLKNNGSCPWTSGYSLVFERGDQMGAAATNFTAAAINPGQSVDVTVTMTAPAKPGTYQGFFMLKNAAGRKFGIGDKADQAFWVKIVVEGAAGAAIHKSGLLEIPQTFTADLDNGSIGTASGADLQYEVDINSNHMLNFWIPAQQMSRSPSIEDCKNAQMDSPTIPINSLSLGTYFCYVTDQARFGFLEYAGSDTTPGAGKLYLEFTTWSKP